MKRTILSVLLIVLSMLLFAQNGRIEFSKVLHDYGKIDESGGLVQHDFIFKNIGDVPVKITDVQVSCGCMLPVWSRSEIMPGEYGFVKIKYNPKGRPGSFMKSMTVVFEDDKGSQGQRFLSIKGEVIPSYDQKTGEPIVTNQQQDFSLNSFFQYYPGEVRYIDTSSADFKKFEQGLRFILAKDGFVNLHVVSSASKLPSGNGFTNKEVAEIRSKRAKITLYSVIKRLGYNEFHVSFDEDEILVQGPEYRPGRPSKDFEPYQFTRIITPDYLPDEERTGQPFKDSKIATTVKVSPADIQILERLSEMTGQESNGQGGTGTEQVPRKAFEIQSRLNKQLKEALLNMERKLHSEQADHEATKKALEDAQKRLTDAKNLASAGSETEKVQKEKISKLEQQVHALMESKAQAEKRIGELNAQLLSKKGRVSDDTLQKKQLNYELSQAKKAEKQLRDSITMMEAVLNNWQARYNQLRDSRNALQEKLNEAQNKYASTGDLKNNLEQSIEKLKREKVAADVEMKQLNDALSEERNKEVHNMARIAELQSDLQSIRLRRTNSTDSVNILSKRLERISLDLATMEQERTALKVSLEDKEKALQKAIADKDEMEHNYSAKMAEHRTSQAQVDLLNLKLSNLRAADSLKQVEINRLNQELASARNAGTDVNDEIKMLQKELDVNKLKVDQLEKQNKALTNKLFQSSTSLGNAKAELSDIRGQFDEKDKLIASLTATKDSLMASIDMVQEHVSDQSGSIQNIENELIIRNKRIQRLQEEKAALQKQFAEVSNSAVFNGNDLAAELEQKKKELWETQAKLSAERKKNEILKNDLTLSQTKRTDLEQEISNYKTSAQGYEEQIAVLKKDKQSLSSQLEAAMKQVDAQSGASVQFVQEMKSLQEKISQLEKEKELLQDRMTNKNTSLGSASDTLTALKTRLLQKEKEIGDLNLEKQMLEADLNKSDLELTETQTQLSLLRQQISAGKGQQDNTGVLITTMEQALKTLKKDKETNEDSIAALKHEILKYKYELESEKLTTRHLKSKVADKTGEIDRLEKTIADIRSGLGSSDEQIGNTTREKTKLRMLVDQKEQQIKQLKNDYAQIDSDNKLQQQSIDAAKIKYDRLYQRFTALVETDSINRMKLSVAQQELIDSKQREADYLKQAMDLQNRLNSLDKTEFSASNKLEKKSEELLAAQASRNLAEQRNSELEKAMQKSRTDLNKLRKEKDSLVLAITAIQTQVTVSGTGQKQLQNSLKKKEEEITQLETEKTDLESNVKKLTDELLKTNNNAEILQQKLSDLQQQSASAGSSLDMLKLRLNNALYNDSINRLKMADLESRLKVKEESLAMVSTSRDTLSRAITETSAELSRAQEENNLLKQMMEKNNEMSRLTQQKYDDLLASVNSKQFSDSLTTLKVKELQAKLDASQAEIERLKFESSTLKQRYDARNEDYKSTQKELNNISANPLVSADALKKELNDKELALEAANRLTARKDSMNAVLLAQNSLIKRQLSTAKTSRDSVVNLLNQANMMQSVAAEKEKMLREQIDRLQTSLDNRDDSHNTALTAQLETVSGKLRDSIALLSVMRTRQISLIDTLEIVKLALHQSEVALAKEKEHSGNSNQEYQSQTMTIIKLQDKIKKLEDRSAQSDALLASLNKDMKVLRDVDDSSAAKIERLQAKLSKREWELVTANNKITALESDLKYQQETARGDKEKQAEMVAMKRTLDKYKRTAMAAQSGMDSLGTLMASITSERDLVKQKLLQLRQDLITEREAKEKAVHFANEMKAMALEEAKSREKVEEELRKLRQQMNITDDESDLPVTYSVQILLSETHLPLSSSKFKGRTDVFEYVMDNTYKYAVGKYDDIAGANVMKNKLREQGFAYAFIIAFNKTGDRITLKEARELSQK